MQTPMSPCRRRHVRALQIAELLTRSFATRAKMPTYKVSLARGSEQEFETSAEFSFSLSLSIFHCKNVQLNSLKNDNVIKWIQMGRKNKRTPPHAPPLSSHGLPLPAKLTKASARPQCWREGRLIFLTIQSPEPSF